MSDLKSIVTDLWFVLHYVLPGYAFFMTFRACRGDRRASTSATSIINAGIVSAVCVQVLQWVFKPIGNLTLLLVSLAVLSILAMLLARLVDSSIVNRIFAYVFHYTVRTDFWRDIVDCDGMVAMIMRTDTSITGSIYMVDTEGDNRLILLRDYQVFDKTGKLLASGARNTALTVRINNDDLLFLGYRDDSIILSMDKLLDAKGKPCKV